MSDLSFLMFDLNGGTFHVSLMRENCVGLSRKKKSLLFIVPGV